MRPALASLALACGLVTSPWAQPAPLRVAILADDAMPESLQGCLAVLGSAEGVEVCEISGAAIREGGLREIDVLILPGGSGSAQCQALGKFGRGNVLTRVAGGMGAIGICAGGYAMIQGAGKVPLVNASLLDGEHWARGVAMLRVRPAAEGAAPFEMQYWNGPLWSPASAGDLPPFATLATFVDDIHEGDAPEGLVPGTPAIVAAPYRHGRVVLFSPHPEMTPGCGHLLESAVRWASRGRRAAEPPITWDEVFGNSE